MFAPTSTKCPLPDEITRNKRSNKLMSDIKVRRRAPICFLEGAASHIGRFLSFLTYVNQEGVGTRVRGSAGIFEEKYLLLSH